MNAPAPLPPDPPETFPFGTAFRAACIVFFVVALAVCAIRESLWGLDSETLVPFGFLAIVLFFVSLWFSELRRGKILTEQHKGVSRREEPAKFRLVMIVQGIVLSVFLALAAIGACKDFFHAESAEGAEPEPHAKFAEDAETPFAMKTAPCPPRDVLVE